jgi:uncharacterized lipoprotein YmbA
MKKSQTILIWAFATIAVGQLVSCSGMSSANKSLYALDVGKATAAQADSFPVRPVLLGQSRAGGVVSRDQVLQIRRVNISPPYDGLSLVYRTKDGTYLKDYYNEWVTAPEELFTTQLVDYLSESSAFASVVDARSSATHRYALEMCINSLYGDFQDTQHPQVVLAARFHLIDDSAGNRRVVCQKHYDITVPLATTSARDLAQGAGNAYRQLLETVTEDLFAFGRTPAAAASAR